MDLVDTHLHLDDARFEADRGAVLERAYQAGVRDVITCGSDLASSEANLALARRFSERGEEPPDPAPACSSPARVWVAVGIHPHEAGRVADLEEAARRIETLAAAPQVVAIGEIGLDYHYRFAPPGVQQAVFERQLALAQALGKPAIIHAREAERQVLDTLARYPGVRGVLHAFAGTAEQAREALDLGWYLGIGGMLTFPSARQVREVASSVPIERVLLETDAPYLAPVPHRGKRNEPAYVPVIARALAELRGLEAQAVAASTTAAAAALFGIPR
ncbi:MAG: TatD family hydrolase [Limnochordaceae bacterium]|nr:TatD family hydrolase [Limnochordaceae bacterium]